MTEPVPLLQVQNLSKHFAGVAALERVGFDLRAGEVHALCGENGAGKSTLIKVLSGVWPHGTYAGTVTLAGREVRFRSTAEAARAGIAAIHQELALVPDMTVAENIYLGAEPRTWGGTINWNKVYADTEGLLREYGIAVDSGARVGELGVGQQQLVEIVKALSKRSRILLLDEPTAALTDSDVETLLGIVQQLRSRGITCVYISHKLGEVFRVADRITVLRDGRSIVTVASAGSTRQDIIRHMVGREITDFFPRVRSAPGPVLMELSGVSVADPRSGRMVLRDVSCNIRAGEVLGIGGLMGAGRTELLLHLFGAFGRRVAGNVTLTGVPYQPHTPADAMARGVALVSEDRKRYGLVLDQSVGFNLSLASLRQVARAGLTGLDSAVAALSGGNQQKVVLGKTLLCAPGVVLLDEPTRGIDVGAKVEVYELVNRLTGAGKAVVLVSSEMPELLGMSDRIMMLSAGQVGGCFTHAEATPERLLTAAMAFHSGFPKDTPHEEKH
ncbi:MAG: sugar ABC transporter ATP-binding protein [bacterium]|nr:sugar ABC transporter ATP-binding protein [bacterium]